MHYLYEITYQPGDKNSAADALSRKEELCPEHADECNPNILFPSEHFVELALMAFNGKFPEPMEIVETTTIADGQLIQSIADHIHNIDPVQWPTGYELNEELVLVSKDTSCIWVPPDKQL